jgi:hypothetical protein
MGNLIRRLTSAPNSNIRFHSNCCSSQTVEVDVLDKKSDERDKENVKCGLCISRIKAIVTYALWLMSLVGMHGRKKVRKLNTCDFQNLKKKFILNTYKHTEERNLKIPYSNHFCEKEM